MNEEWLFTNKSKNMASFLRIIPVESFLYFRMVYIILFFLASGCLSQNDSESQDKIEVLPTLVIHGGAGTITKDNMTPEMEIQIREKLEEALNEGYGILKNGGSSTEAVIRTIQVMEESPLFNAGKGAVFTYDGKNEMDAAIMEGESGMAGAVAGVSRIKSPIEAAYAVMTKSPHVLLTGTGADEFASQNGLDMVNPEYFYTEKRYKQLLQYQKSEKDSDNGKTSLTDIQHMEYKFGTVGAIALDRDGNLAAGTSTGGMTNKRFGRVGDVPLIGAGTYACNETCAVSATGHGEFFIRNVVAYDIAARMKYQEKDVETAANEVIDELRMKEGFGGVICLDAKGNIAMPFNTAGMYRGYIKAYQNAQVMIFGTEDASK